MVIIYANGLFSISYSIWIRAIGKAQLHYWLQCPHRHFQNVTDRICCLRLKASALLAFVWVANEPTEWAKPAENALLFPEVNLTLLCNMQRGGWAHGRTQPGKPRKGGDTKLFRTPSYLPLDAYFQSQKPKSEQFGRKPYVMITHAWGIALPGGRPALFPLWWTPVTTSSSSAAAPEPHPRHQAGAGASHVCLPLLVLSKALSPGFPTQSLH